MTTPIDPRPPLLFPEPSLVQPVNRPVPGGVGSAPDRLEKPPAKEKGYIERGVLAIRDWVIYFFTCLFGCFFKAKEVPADTPPAPPPAPPPNPMDELARLRTKEEIIAAFERGYISDEARTRVYINIGESAPRGGLVRWKTAETIGREMVDKNPRLLLAYLVVRYNNS